MLRFRGPAEGGLQDAGGAFDAHGKGGALGSGEEVAEGLGGEGQG